MTTALQLPDQDPAVVDYRARALAIRHDACTIIVDSEDAKMKATAILGACAGLKRDAETKRTEIVGPFNDFVKRVNDLFRQVLLPIIQSDEHLRAQLLKYQRIQAERAAEATARAERERLESEALLKEAERVEASGNAGVAEGLLGVAVAKEESAKVAATQAAPPPRTTSTPFGSSTVRKVWTFEVADLAAVPREYLELNESKLRRAIMEGVREVPGVKIFQTESLSVRR